MKDDSGEQGRRADDEVRKNLPAGVKLVRTLRGYESYTSFVAWSLTPIRVVNLVRSSTAREAWRGIRLPFRDYWRHRRN